jgi:hypothetical protein
MNEPTATQAPHRPPFLTRMLRKLVALGLLVLVLVLVFATWANHRREGAWSFRVFDPVWWGVGREEATPYVDGARDAAHSAYTWSQETLTEAEAWLKKANEPKPEPAPVANNNTEEEKIALSGEDRSKLETALATAQDTFEEGLIAYRQAKPDRLGGEPDPTALRTAISKFKRTRDLLEANVPAYNKVSGKNLRILADAEELEGLNRRMLQQAQQLADR